MTRQTRETLDLDDLFDGIAMEKGSRTPAMESALSTVDTLARTTVGDFESGLRVSSGNPQFRLTDRDRELQTVRMRSYLLEELEHGACFADDRQPQKTPGRRRGTIGVDLSPRESGPFDPVVRPGDDAEGILNVVLSRLQSRVGVGYGDTAARFFSDDVSHNDLSGFLKRAKEEKILLEIRDLMAEKNLGIIYLTPSPQIAILFL